VGDNVQLMDACALAVDNATVDNNYYDVLSTTCNSCIYTKSLTTYSTSYVEQFDGVLSGEYRWLTFCCDLHELLLSGEYGD